MKQILLWLRIIRPQTLFASLVPVLVGLKVAGVSDWRVAVFTALCALSLSSNSICILLNASN